MGRLTGIDIVNRSFTKALRGYVPVEVDSFVQEVGDLIGRLLDEKKEQAERIATLEAQLAEYRDRESTLRDTLMTTQRVTDDMKSAAQREAQSIVDAAHVKAEELTNEAYLTEAKVREDIAALRKLRAQFEMKIRQVIEQYLHALDYDKGETTSTEPGLGMPPREDS